MPFYLQMSPNISSTTGHLKFSYIQISYLTLIPIINSFEYLPAY